MPRYFQHIDSTNDTLFCKVTELAYIDDVSDPDMVLFVFTDGTKCNKALTAVVNTPDAYKQYAMIEVESPQHIFKFTKRDVDFGEPMIKTKDMNGQDVLVPNPNYYDTAGNYHEPVTMDVEAPRRCIKTLGDIEVYYLSRIKEALESGDELADDIDVSKLPAFIFKGNNIPVKKTSASNKVTEVDSTTEGNVEEKIEPVVSKPELTPTNSSFINNLRDTSEDYFITNGPEPCYGEIKVNPDITVPRFEFKLSDDYIFSITLDSNLTGPKEIVLKDKDGNTIKTFTSDDLLRALTASSEKYGDIKVEGADPASEELIKGMIAMSAKEDSDIEMSLGLQIPPRDLFTVIQKVYTEKHTRLFVNTISNQIPESVLRKSIADGLFEFYTGNNETGNK